MNIKKIFQKKITNIAYITHNSAVVRTSCWAGHFVAALLHMFSLFPIAAFLSKQHCLKLGPFMPWDNNSDFIQLPPETLKSI